MFETALVAAFETGLAPEIVFTSAFGSVAAGEGVRCIRGVCSAADEPKRAALPGDGVIDATRGAFGITSSSVPDLSGGVEPVVALPTSRNAS